MGRRADGFRVSWKRGWAYVRFTHEGADWRTALGTRDPREALTLAAAEYSAALSGRRRQAVARHGVAARPLVDLLAEWVDDQKGVLDDTTVETLETYCRHYLGFFGSLAEVTAASARDYTRARLRSVLRRTVLKELTFLRGFLRWAVDRGHLSEAPVIEPPPGKATGVRSGPQRAHPVAIDLEQALAIVAELPERSKAIGGRRWPIRGRFLFAWETGLRPATLARLRMPDHYRPGARELVLEDSDDKARYGRALPLTDSACKALDACVPPGGKGLIFGAHRFDKVLKTAASHVLGAQLAASFAPYDFRHGRGTHLADGGAPLTGVAYLLGHRRVSTTDKYLAPSRRAGERALAAVGAPFPPPRASDDPKNGGDRRGLNPRHLEPQRSADHEIIIESLSEACPEASENAAQRHSVRPGGGNWVDRLRADLEAALAEELAHAERWRVALESVDAGDEEATWRALADLEARFR